MYEIKAKQALLPDGWGSDVAIVVGDDGRIDSVTPGAASGPATHDLVLPAQTNLHSHAFQRAMSGLTEARGPDPRDSFWTWRRLMYRFLDQLDPDQVQVIASLVYMEMLEAGYASVAEFHYLHHDVGGRPYDDLAEIAGRITAAATETGIGLTLLPVLYSNGGCDGRALQGGQRRFGNDLDQFLALHEKSAALIGKAADDYSIGVAPHSLRAVSTEALRELVTGSAEKSPIHMHLAEQVAEVEEVEAYLGARPVEWLLENHDVNDRWCLIHVTQMKDHETLGLAATGAVAGLCPITESNLGDGIFEGTTYLPAGGSFGVGSDSNVHISLFHELTTLEYSQRLRDRSRAALATPEKSTGRVLYEESARGGAQAGGRRSGQIKAGDWGDLIGLSTDTPALAGRGSDQLLDSLLFSGQGGNAITDVWSAGRHMVKNGRHALRDRIVADYVALMKSLQLEI
ncbi:formimidoylglutamate deiminase [Ruegeria arenilitoris]|uniref:formimidoylglutamate deiminase n=1 Tax=Ruegeria arenilitoris TaxID=1173585 RepID=UPI0014816896|nr:formimidoylglutamate deiminase [Ruegeria arenilitoris]